MIAFLEMSDREEASGGCHRRIRLATRTNPHDLGTGNASDHSSRSTAATGDREAATAMHTVLVIEDDPDMREIEQTALQGNGYEVILAANGLEGLDALGQSPPCVILLDLMMPVMDGLTFLAERQKRRLGEGVPVVCVSAGGDEMAAHALRLGAEECISKPADFEELFSRIEHYCPHPHSARPNAVLT